MLSQEAVIQFGEDLNEDPITTVESDSSVVHVGPAKLTLDNDPISFAVLICVTAIIMAYFTYKLKSLKK